MRAKPVLLAALLVLASVAGPTTGPAAATHDCSQVDALVFGFSFGNVNQDKCTNNHVYHAVEEVRDAEENQTKVDLYSAGSGAKSQAQNYNVLYDNYLQDTESIAWSKAEVAIAEAYKNGSTKSEAKIAAKEAISKYYANKQTNLVKSWNTSITSFEYIDERATQEGFNNFVLFNESNPYDSWATPPHHETVSVNQLTTVNSSTVSVKSYVVEGDDGAESFTFNANPGAGTIVTGTSTYDVTVRGIDIAAPDSNYDKLHYMRFKPYVDRWGEIETKNSNLQSESDTFVDAIWTDLEAGNINSSDVVSRNTLMFEYGSSAQQNGTYYDSIGAAAGMGLSTPNLNQTGVMQVTTKVNGNSYTGMLFGNPPNSTWDVGTEYDASTISSPVFFATEGGDFFEITGNFTVDAATDKSGDSRTTVKTQEYRYQTSNTTELNQQMIELLELTQELQERSESVNEEPSGGGGTTSGSFLSNMSPKQIAAGVAVIGTFLLLKD